MKEFENEDISLFEELYTGLKQALDFAKNTGEAKITLCDNASYDTVNFEMASMS